ncbi:MAG: hypothetical protein WKH64_03860 [Chloroflexia bacterium]
MPKSRAIVFTEVNQVELQEYDLPDPKPDELVIRTEYSGVSQGTEIWALKAVGRRCGSPSYLATSPWAWWRSSVLQRAATKWATGALHDEPIARRVPTLVDGSARQSGARTHNDSPSTRSRAGRSGRCRGGAAALPAVGLRG